MVIYTLGVYGSKFKNKNLATFLFLEKDDFFLIDAGSLYSKKDIIQFCEKYKTDEIKIFLTHAHLDHISELPFFLDFLVSTPYKITLYLSLFTKKLLKNHLFNNKIWPDFSKIKNAKGKYVLNYKFIKPFQVIKLKNIKIIPFKVSHVIETYGYFISNKKTYIYFSGDTNSVLPIFKFIKRNYTKQKSYLFVDISFSSKNTKIANLSKHYSSLKFIKDFFRYKLNKHFKKIFVYHIKPWEEDLIKKELDLLSKYIYILKDNEEIKF